MQIRARQMLHPRAVSSPFLTWASRSAGVVAGGLAALAVAAPAAAQDAQKVTDNESGRAILVVVVGLVVLGLVLTAVTVWFWNVTRPDHPALGPLEVLGGRSFASLSSFEQRQRLDAVRPRATVVSDSDDQSDGPAASESVLDLQRLVSATPTSFDDLAEPATPIPLQSADDAAPSPDAESADAGVDAGVDAGADTGVDAAEPVAAAEN